MEARLLILLPLCLAVSAQFPGWIQQNGKWIRVNFPTISYAESSSSSSSENTFEANKEALDLYRLGWAQGDVEIILSVLGNETFTFTWVPDNRAVTPGEFREFYEGFKSDAVAATNKPYFMSFDSIIHREVDGVLYEAADWIIDGYQRGAYFNNAKNGKVVWDMATLAGLGTK